MISCCSYDQVLFLKAHWGAKQSVAGTKSVSLVLAVRGLCLLGVRVVAGFSVYASLLWPALSLSWTVSSLCLLRLRFLVCGSGLWFSGQHWQSAQSRKTISIG